MRWSNQYGWNDCIQLWSLPHYEISTSATHRSSTPGASQGICREEVRWGERVGSEGFLEIKSTHLSRLLHNLFRSHRGSKVSRRSPVTGWRGDGAGGKEEIHAQGRLGHPRLTFWAPEGGKTWTATVLSAYISGGPHPMYELEQPIFKVTASGWTKRLSWTLWGQRFKSCPRRIWAACPWETDLASPGVLAAERGGMPGSQSCWQGLKQKENNMCERLPYTFTPPLSPATTLKAGVIISTFSWEPRFREATEWRRDSASGLSDSKSCVFSATPQVLSKW